MEEISELERKRLERLSLEELFVVSVLLESGACATVSEALRELEEERSD